MNAEPALLGVGVVLPFGAVNMATYSGYTLSTKMFHLGPGSRGSEQQGRQPCPHSVLCSSLHSHGMLNRFPQGDQNSRPERQNPPGNPQGPKFISPSTRNRPRKPGLLPSTEKSLAPELTSFPVSHTSACSQALCSAGQNCQISSISQLKILDLLPVLCPASLCNTKLVTMSVKES